MRTLCFLSLLALAACADSRSSGIENSEVYAVYTVTGDSDTNKVTCAADLTVGGAGPSATTITLDDQDVLSCGLNNAYTDLSKSSAGHYKVSDITLTEGGSYSVRFTRTGGCEKSGTFTGTVALPHKIAISSPAAAATVSKAAGLTVTWAAGDGDSVQIALSSSNNDGSGAASASSSDTGTHTFAAADLANLKNGSGTLTLTRSKSGAAPTGIKGGSTTAQTTTKIAITVAD